MNEIIIILMAIVVLIILGSVSIDVYRNYKEWKKRKNLYGKNL